MSVAEAAGLAAFSRILAELGEGQSMSINELIAVCQLRRSTGFDVVRRMEARGFVTRTTDGRYALGPTAGAFGYAAFGLGPLYETAQALLSWLRDEADATVVLEASDGATYTNLQTWSAPWFRRDLPGLSTLLVSVAAPGGQEVARLRLLTGRQLDDRAVEETLALARKVAARLGEALMDAVQPS
ncbi:helix-turn-helix domain-containing protein [Kaistia geumhonensis]|uniref:DNA-binding IclR family transcriptional regulator n=1 Tax=Kaistia geumhonensis TaxID=410839 RepID=A0ABU0M6Z9_9HYPH|nr:helix-turn-helix domain-containing protein [Kaistia geumhonensis]MCX5478062.1 helix-turn-helix domain-containing protein [Kaistia geumhonensis]MDQ0516722.1 DNA-binding IclR family transcriptional regulator [Kaistia geumhonensis]